jgi:hypothetical protein
MVCFVNRCQPEICRLICQATLLRLDFFSSHEHEGSHIYAFRGKEIGVIDTTMHGSVRKDCLDSLLSEIAPLLMSAASTPHSRTLVNPDCIRIESPPGQYADSLPERERHCSCSIAATKGISTTPSSGEQAEMHWAHTSTLVPAAARLPMGCTTLYSYFLPRVFLLSLGFFSYVWSLILFNFCKKNIIYPVMI